MFALLTAATGSLAGSVGWLVTLFSIIVVAIWLLYLYR